MRKNRIMRKILRDIKLLSWMQIHRDTTRGTKGGQKGGLLSPLEDWAKDVVLGVPGWTPEAKAFLTEKPGAFRAAMHFQPSWQDDTQFSSETNNVRSSLWSASAPRSQWHSFTRYPVYGNLCMHWWRYASKRLCDGTMQQRTTRTLATNRIFIELCLAIQ